MVWVELIITNSGQEGFPLGPGKHENFTGAVLRLADKDSCAVRGDLDAV
jgi:hypothetical protein